jgi:hypothetical protein
MTGSAHESSSSEAAISSNFEYFFLLRKFLILNFFLYSLKKQVSKGVLYKGRLLERPNGFDEPSRHSYEALDRLVSKMYIMPNEDDLHYMSQKVSKLHQTLPPVVMSDAN